MFNRIRSSRLTLLALRLNTCLMVSLFLSLSLRLIFAPFSDYFMLFCTDFKLIRTLKNANPYQKIKRLFKIGYRHLKITNKLFILDRVATAILAICSLIRASVSSILRVLSIRAVHILTRISWVISLHIPAYCLLITDTAYDLIVLSIVHSLNMVCAAHFMT
jgi:hypothetical protein